MDNKRVISAFIGIPAVYIFILWGGLAFFLLVLALAVKGLGEFFRMSDEKKLPSVKLWALAVVVMMFLNAYSVTSGSHPGWEGDLSPFIIFLAVAGVMLLLVIKKDIKEAAVSAGITLTGIFYVGWLFVHAVFLREKRPYGYEFTVIAVFCTWMADSAAFYIGGKYGKKPLHASSPNKSRAGAVAALAGASASAVILVRLLPLIPALSFTSLDFMTFTQTAFIGALIGVGAVSGDLCESALKRSFGAKESGSFLPGHGGVLDRIDSLLFTIPIVYYCMTWFLL